jgi:hypothetical protein
MGSDDFPDDRMDGLPAAADRVGTDPVDATPADTRAARRRSPARWDCDVADGTILIYDPDDPDAWIRSDRSMPAVDQQTDTDPAH